MRWARTVATCALTVVLGGVLLGLVVLPGASAVSAASGVREAAAGQASSSPRLSVRSTPVAVTRSLGPTGLVAAYQVTVTNHSEVDARIVNDVRDRLDLPASATVSRAEVREGGSLVRTVTGAELTDPSGFVVAEAGSGQPLAKAAPGTGDGGTRVLGVQVYLTVDPHTDGFTADDYDCARTRADGRPAGLVGTAVMEGDSDGAGNDSACLSTTARLHFHKVVSSRPGPGSTFDVGYTVTVQNQGALPGRLKEVLDQPAFAPAAVVSKVTVSKDGGPAQEVAAADGSYRLDSNETIDPGQTLTWVVTVNVTVDPSDPAYDQAALSCRTAPGTGRLQEGHGLLSRLVTPPGTDVETGLNHDRACTDMDAGAGRRGFTVIRSGSQGRLEGAVFELYSTDPAAAGAVPVDRAVTPTGAKGQFNVAPQPVGREYWLVEAVAPPGRARLASPVHVRITAAGIQVLNGNRLGLSTATATASAAASPNVADTLTINDVEAARLPRSGGPGLLPHVAVATGLLVLAGALHLRQRLQSGNKS